MIDIWFGQTYGPKIFYEGEEKFGLKISVAAKCKVFTPFLVHNCSVLLFNKIYSLWENRIELSRGL